VGETFPTEVWDKEVMEEDERRVSVYVEGGVNIGAIMVCSIVEIECMQGPAGEGGTFTIVYSLTMWLQGCFGHAGVYLSIYVTEVLQYPRTYHTT